jgi:hypothetical protein
MRRRAEHREATREARVEQRGLLAPGGAWRFMS